MTLLEIARRRKNTRLQYALALYVKAGQLWEVTHFCDARVGPEADASKQATLDLLAARDYATTIVREMGGRIPRRLPPIPR